MKKILIIILTFNFYSCIPARISYNTHPDHNFSPTRPSSITVYNGFLPVKKFLIIGKLTMTEIALTSMKMSLVKLKKITASMGGNAVLISGSRVAWRQYSQAVTTGQADIRQYGYTTYASWQSRTRRYSRNVPMAIFHYCYAIRFLDYEEPDLLKNREHSRISVAVKSVNLETREVSVCFGGIRQVLLKATSPDSTLPGLDTKTALVYYQDGSVALEFERDGILNKVLFKEIFRAAR